MSKELKIRKLFEKANQLLSQGKNQEADQNVRKLLKLQPNHYSGLHLSGVILMSSGKFQLAKDRLLHAVKFAPDETERQHLYERLTQVYMQLGDSRACLTMLQKLLSLSPSRVDVEYRIAEIYRAQSDFESAKHHYTSVLESVGPKVEVVLGYAKCLHQTGEVNTAIELLKNTQENENRVLRVELASCFQSSGDIKSAKEVLQKLAKALPQDQDIQYKLALFYRGSGLINESLAIFEALLEQNPQAATLYYNYSRLKSFSADDPHIEKMYQCYLGLDSEVSQSKAEILFALGKVSEDIGEYENAFEYWKKGNQVKRQLMSYVCESDHQRLADVYKTFTSDWLNGFERTESDCRLIFVISMPRAGSTLVEQILSSHSDVFSAGESMALPLVVSDLERIMGKPFPQCLHNLSQEQLLLMRQSYLQRLCKPNESQLIVDKLPGNFWLVGLIKLMFPDAVVVNSERNRLDTLFSCFKHLFGQAQAFSYAMDDIQTQYDIYRQCVAFWRELYPDMIEVNYDVLVSQPEENIRSLLVSCGLPWEEQCLSFHRAERIVTTASAAQVRQPINTRGVGVWKRYQDQIEANSQWLDEKNNNSSQETGI